MSNEEQKEYEKSKQSVYTDTLSTHGLSEAANEKNLRYCQQTRYFE